MKTQFYKQQADVVVQPLTATHNHGHRKFSGHRLSIMFAVAMSFLLFGLICSAQTSTYIPQYSSSGTTNSIMNQPSSTEINVNGGNFNLTDWTKGFQIGGETVLKANDFDWTGYHRSLSIGIGAGSISSTVNGTGSNLFVGDRAGYANTNSTANVFLGASAGYANSTGGWNTCVGDGACGSSNTNANTMVGVFSGFYTTGGSNTFLGTGAGGSTTTGSSNIYLGPNAGGAPTESNTIRIGVQGTGSGQQSSTYIAGIVNHSVSNAANVYISPSGQLEVGTAASGVTGTCGSGSGNFATWTSGTTLGCVTNLSDNGTTLNVTGNIAVSNNVTANNLTAGYATASTVNATSGYIAEGKIGLTYSVHLKNYSGASCYLTFTDGLLTASNC